MKIILILFLILVLILCIVYKHTSPKFIIDLPIPMIDASSNKEISNYLKMVYPNSTLSKPLQLCFIYSCAPSIIKNIYKLSPRDSYKPVDLYTFWQPIWYPENCYSLNLYPPNNWMNFIYLNKYTDNMSIEGIHSRDDNPWYTVWGLWIYVTKGTGVFYNIGKTLQAYNKIHALYLLGVSIPDIASLLIDKYYYYNPDKPNLKIIDVAKEHFSSTSDLNSMINLISYILDKNDVYDYDRINNTADIDSYIIFLAKSKHYDSIQFQVQANGMGGWGFEIVFTNFTILSKPNEVTWGGWEEFSDKITLNDPLNELDTKKCTIQKNMIVSCKEQQLCVK